MFTPWLVFMAHHIILSAFGTTTQSGRTYGVLDERISSRFKDCSVHWHYSSPSVRRSLDQNKAKQPSLRDVLHNLAGNSPYRIVVQPLHVMAGQEFHRVVREAKEANATAAIGMPLLCTPDDFHRVAGNLMPLIEENESKAILILGHGTTHPSWTTYPALEKILRTQAGNRVFVTGLEKYPGPEAMIDEIAASGFDRVFIIPLLMATGMHFQRDIVGTAPNSWKSRLKSKRIELSYHDRGLALLPGIAEIFCDHIRTALG